MVFIITFSYLSIIIMPFVRCIKLDNSVLFFVAIFFRVKQSKACLRKLKRFCLQTNHFPGDLKSLFEQRMTKKLVSRFST